MSAPNWKRWPEMLAGLDLSTRRIAEITKAWTDLDAARRSQIEAFRRDSPRATIVELDHTLHHCFIQRKERVVSRKLGNFFSAPSEGDISVSPFF
jgi:hypothetical protein